MTDHRRILLVFILHALVVGSLFSRIAEIQRDLGLDEATFGLTLMGVPAGVLLGSVLVSWMIEGIGTRKTLMVFMPLFGAGPYLASVAMDGGQLFAALLVFGLTLSCANIAMNVEADRIEAAAGERNLNRCHGSWGLGFLVVSSLGAVAIKVGISPEVHFLLLFALMVLTTLTLLRRSNEAPPRRHAGEAPPKRFALPNRGTFLIVGFVLAGMWLEGTVRNWGVIYLRDGFGALDWHAALALPAMMLTQTLGRFLADGWVSRYGDVKVARALTCVAFAGLAVIVTTHDTVVALLGFMLIGLGISTVFPQAVSAAAKWGDRPASENVAAFSSLQTIIAFMAPPVIGFLASWMGLRMALAIFLPLPLLTLYFARYLAPRPS
ncbi:MAG: MFS transporter [Paracoccaceae bacterium]